MSPCRRNSTKLYIIYRSVELREDATKSIEEVLQCPVCLDFLSAPIWSCLEGHSICGTCYDKLNASSKTNRCQVCRSKAGYVARNRCTEAIIYAFTSDCDYGCSLKLVLGEYRAHQEKACKFRYRYSTQSRVLLLNIVLYIMFIPNNNLRIGPYSAIWSTSAKSFHSNLWRHITKNSTICKRMRFRMVSHLQPWVSTLGLSVY